MISEELARLRRVAERPGRHRIARLIEPLAATAWWRRLDAIKITGSNGKGSVATMTTEILRAAGVRVGLTISPHVVDFGERMQVDGIPASPATLERAFARLDPRLRPPHADPDDPPTTFEATTALAAQVFAQAEVETVVAEAGIGGRNDATGVFPGSDTALVSVDLEHTAILGSTLAEIALDKADLAPEGSTLVVGRLPAEVVRVVTEHCVGRRRIALVPAGFGSLPVGACPFPGAHQRANARLAATLARRWLTRHRPALDRGAIVEAIRTGLAATRLPLRFEKVADDPPVWIDSAHTRDAVTGLVDTACKLIDRPILLVAGLSVDKQPQVLDPLIDVVARVVLTRAAERGGSPAPLLQRCGERGRIVEPAARAIELAVDEAARDGLAVLVAGGVLLAREIRSALLDARRSPA
ncbi:MAG: hypothetical protein AAGE94_05180 [Acidobacteriota bacterium]